MNYQPDLSRIELVVSDIDGTLLNDDGILTEKTKWFINLLINNGIKVSLATGRLHSAVERLAEEINFKGEIISLDGSVIKSYPEGLKLYESFVKQKVVERAINLAKNYLVNIALCHSDAIYFTENNSFIPEILTKYGARYQEVDSYVNYINNTLEIIFVSDMLDSITAIKKQFEFPRSFGCEISYYRSMSKKKLHFLEVRKSGSSKGLAIKRLLNRYKIKWRNIAVVGDWYNDVSMFETKALKVALENAVPELKAKADIITSAGNNEDGITEFFDMILKSRGNKNAG